jgi:membrane protease YdiL (CAAX protease family)
MPKFLAKENTLRHATALAAYLLIVWGFYRLIFTLPEEIEELLIKPLIWLVPVFVLVAREGKNLESVGISLKNLFPSIYFALGLGAIFVMEALVLNYLKYGGLNFAANIGNKILFAALGISFVTAIAEEITFRGYIFSRVWAATGDEWLANLSTNCVWILIHIPWLLFVQRLTPGPLLVNLVVTGAFGVGSAFVFARTRNILSSIFLHVLWAWPIILFR